MPRFPRRQRIQRQLHVVPELLDGLRPRGLVVDQLVLGVGALTEAIHPVDPPAEMVGAELKGERPLEPDRLAVLLAEPRVVARQGGSSLREQLELVLPFAERAPAPSGVEQGQHLLERARLFAVVALEHLVHDDPEPLVDRLLARDAKDARELVGSARRPQMEWT